MLQCRKHKRYKGIQKPKIDCLECWSVYLGAKLDGPKIHEHAKAGKLLAQYRKRAKLTPLQLAKMVSTNVSNIHNIERGGCGASESLTDRLTTALKIKGDEAMIFKYHCLVKHRRLRAIIAFDITSDVGQAMTRLALQEYRDFLEEQCQN